MGRRLFLQAVLVVAVVVVISAPAHANYIYSYVGNPYTEISLDQDPPSGTYTASMMVTASFVLSTPLAPNLPFTDISGSPELLSFSINDGRRTYSSLDQLGTLEISTNPLGEVFGWNVSAGIGFFGGEVGDEFGGVLTRSLPSLPSATDDADIEVCSAVGGTANLFCVESTRDRAVNFDQPGVWTVVPEPSTALLMGVGLAAIARRRP
jgi:hypothetical protein